MTEKFSSRASFSKLAQDNSAVPMKMIFNAAMG
jgi:hypothetical protein